MGRPKRDDGQVAARQRLISAFWDLLEDARVDELTVGALCAKAQCSRSAFYYHFIDLDDLMLVAIRDELLGPNGIPGDILALAIGAVPNDLWSALAASRIERFALVVQKCGNRDVVERDVKMALIDMWQEVLCPDGGALRPGARAVVKYATGGMLALILDRVPAHVGLQADDEPLPTRFLSAAGAFTLAQICEEQGVDQQQVLARLRQKTALRADSEV